MQSKPWCSTASVYRAHDNALLDLRFLMTTIQPCDCPTQVIAHGGLPRSDGQRQGVDSVRCPPFHDAARCDRSCAVRARARSLAVPAPAGWTRHSTLCRFVSMSGADRRPPVQSEAGFGSDDSWVFWSVPSPSMDQLLGSAFSTCKANFSSTTARGRSPRFFPRQDISPSRVVGVGPGSWAY